MHQEKAEIEIATHCVYVHKHWPDKCGSHLAYLHTGVEMSHIVRVEYNKAYLEDMHGTSTAFSATYTNRLAILSSHYQCGTYCRIRRALQKC